MFRIEDRDSGSLLLEAALAITIAAILLLAVYSIFRSAQNTISTQQTTISEHIRILQLQRYLDVLSNRIEAPYWQTIDQWSFDDKLTIPNVIAYSGEVPYFADATISNTDSGLLFFIGAEESFLFPDMSIESIEPVLTNKQGARGIQLSIVTSNNNRYSVLLPFSVRQFFYGD